MILAFTGAGISKASGIPTFEDQGDLRLKLSRDFQIHHTDEYNQVIKSMQEACNKAQPNDAHKALAEYGVPIITMNVDGLHTRAGSRDVIEIHGLLPNIVLYGDPAPYYSTAMELTSKLIGGDIFLIIGVSFYTNIASQLKSYAEIYNAKVEIINDNAETKVRKFLEEHKDTIGTYEELSSRTFIY